MDAHLVGEGIARQLEQRVAFRRAQKQAIQRAMRAGAKGIKTQVSGRLNGADIARAEGYSEGTGRVWSELINTISFLPFANSSSVLFRIGYKNLKQ